MFKHLAFLSIAIVTLCGESARGDLVIKVSVADPSAVVFTSLDVNAQNNDSTGSTKSGVTFEGFFSSSTSLGLVTIPSATRTLTPAGGTGPYTSVINTFGDLLGTDLNMYGGPGTMQQFSVLNRAFTGASIVNLSAYPLPSPGATGDIIVGDRTGGDSGVVIGQWVAVPEPSPVLYGSVVSLLLSLGSRWRRCG
ncbi:MAG: hypothetical protein KDA61_14350 [Planctomycetales bacterium]|nr:hypothetical protein [Planctomycetales bacterium]